MSSEIGFRYQRFAEVEAKGVCDIYYDLALEVARAPEIQTLLATLPKHRQQPNLLFAALRKTASLPGDSASLTEMLSGSWAAIREVMMTHTTQTNEPGRCACLLPVLSQIKGPIALLEVGASAGLCLLPERYDYTYGAREMFPDGGLTPDLPVFPCQANAGVPLPSAMPDIIWRAGLDLNPLDVNSALDMDWLETLVWPGQEGRRDRLSAAITIAKEDPPVVAKGSLLTSDFEDLARTAPSDAQLVVFHTAVLSYIDDQEERERFAQRVAQLGAIWISNESPRIFPRLAERAPRPHPVGKFLMTVNSIPTAWTGPHGQSIDWIEG